MTKSTITRERLEKIKSWRETYGAGSNVMLPAEEAEELASMALAAMDSEQVELPLDYLKGNKDGLEWAAQLAEANHPETGDWLYDDPIELAKAIRKGPDMQPVQPVADSEPVIVVGDDGGDALSYRRLIQSFEPGTKLYRHAQPAPVLPDGYVMVPKEPTESMVIAGFESEPDEFFSESEVWEAFQKMSGCEQAAFRARLCWAAMLAAAPHDTPALNSVQSVVTVPGKWIPVSERMPEDRTQVILWDAEIGEVTSGHYSHKTQTFYHCGDAIENEITHWMLPPSAPQGVKP
ncbi:TPA: DUF551 domain-containing protein [Klebsiella variicola]|nr:DUF551 domain-containing protein [Klebsiella variicola]HCA8416614.1 DUF551 domain-containing protein [Klebsiella variicola]HCA9021654.1 DUF551 domain-containing protein [Klebsiella variicola]HCA9038257.1 DUF551 domain-containing protein [Klebsiella variicola]HCA9054276.1 DUF551 domain-containing protein [Klebsiella variicola]